MVNNLVLETIKKRRSTRSYLDKQISQEDLQAILEAGIYAPSAGNQQSWHFTVIQDQAILADINKSAKLTAVNIDNEHISKMAKNEQYNIFHGAPTVIVISGKEDGLMIEADCAAATQNMLLAAESIGLGCCWVDLILFAFSGDKGDQYKKQLGIPEGYKPFHSVTLGYKKVEAINAPSRKQNVVNYIR
ncbi:nitroreductase family protein [Dendrosporobacter sp. 1207_IL3150]|uniref:nitroreductase family protein n=1 Tax=Dendrosporobacter sp. 1207_IL3150 TaxID=3084054 RepID=UPI002FD8E422